MHFNAYANRQNCLIVLTATDVVALKDLTCVLFFARVLISLIILSCMVCMACTDKVSRVGTMGAKKAVIHFPFSRLGD